MNILLVAPWRLDAPGGVSNAVAMLYREFTTAGHRVSALIPQPWDAVRPIEDAPEFSLYGMDFRSPYHASRPIRALVSCALLLPVTLWRLGRFLRAARIDVVNIHYPLPAFFYFALLRPFARWRLVVTYQGNDAHDLQDWAPLERRLVRLLLRRADEISGVSFTLIEKVRSALHEPALPGVAVPNGAAVEAIERNSVRVETQLPPIYAVTVGHVIRRKGIDVLLEALRQLRALGVRLPLVIVGDGPERNEFEQLAVRLGVADDVHFVGSFPHEQAIAFVKRSSFFVLASRAEGLPLVIAEAMACGKAVVGTAVDGVPEIVHDGVTGLLVPSEDPTALAAAMRRLHEDPELRDRLARNAQRSASSEYSWRVIARRYLALYRGRDAQLAPL